MSHLIAFTNGARDPRVDPLLSQGGKKAFPGAMAESTAVAAATTTAAASAAAAAGMKDTFISNSGTVMGHRKHLAEEFEKSHRPAATVAHESRRKVNPDAMKQTLGDDPNRVHFGRKVTEQTNLLAGRGLASSFVETSVNNNGPAAGANARKAIATTASADHCKSDCGVISGSADSVAKKTGVRVMSGPPQFVVPSKDEITTQAKACGQHHQTHTRMVPNAIAKSSSIADLISQQENLSVTPSVARRGSTSSTASSSSSIGCGVAQPQAGMSLAQQRQQPKTYQTSYNILTGSPRKVRA